MLGISPHHVGVAGGYLRTLNKLLLCDTCFFRSQKTQQIVHLKPVCDAPFQNGVIKQSLRRIMDLQIKSKTIN